MIFRRFALALAAAACLATAAAIALVALAFAFFKLLRNVLPPAGAAACLCLAAAIVAVLAGLILMRAAKVGGGRGRGRAQAPGAPAGLVDGLADMVRDRPVAAAALAATVGWVLTRSPGLAGVLGTLISRQGRDRRRD